jgi:hypothetical protein
MGSNKASIAWLISSFEKPSTSMAFDRHAEAQEPHPLHNEAFTSAIRFKGELFGGFTIAIAL